MKQRSLLILLTIFFSLNGLITYGQVTKTYQKEWEKVEGFVKKDLPASALVEVKKIYALAKKENQDAQMIKALIYMAEIQGETRENNDSASIREFEKELTTTKQPAASILSNILAEMYWRYYQQNRWNLYDRTATINFKKDDIATWSTEDFHKKVGELYLQSIKNEKILQATKLEGYNEIILKGNVRHLRPTLYDMLAHRALEYFENDESDVKRPAYAFEINSASAFDPTADFIHRKFQTNDSLSLHHKALLIYQELIAFHLNDTKPDALIDVDLRRYEFVRQKSVSPLKEEWYFNGINHIAHQYNTTPAAAQAWYLVAQFYSDRASKYDPFKDTTHRYDKKLAKEICEKILTQKDSSEGKVNCYNLLQQITEKSISFTLENVNVPGIPFRALVNYKNTGRIYLRVIKATDKLNKILENFYDDNYWPTIVNTNAYKAWEQSLPLPEDYQLHKTEIKIDSLQPGKYILLVATDKDFKNLKSAMGISTFYVSNISYIKQENKYFVLDRSSGKPLTGAKVTVLERKYDYSTSKYKDEKFGNYTVDKNGFFKIDLPKVVPNGSHQFRLNISFEKDMLNLDDYDNTYYYYPGGQPNQKPLIQNFLFADRSIYRPGQLVYFKGIVIKTDNTKKGSEIQSATPITIYLRDANSQLIDSMTLTTNEYGSVNGKFQLPAVGSLNGDFTLESKPAQGSLSFKVEEYKRPKFEVSYEPVKGSFKVNDTIKVTGIAKAYAGNSISGAKVSYRVSRKPRYIYFWRGFLPPVSPMEIAHGEVTTNNDGKFDIRFAAIPDLKIDPKSNPVFDYEITADVTDINGETHSADETVSVSYNAIIIKSDIAPFITTDSLRSLKIRTENMSGNFESARVRVIITKLKPEERLIRKRLWERADQFTMTKGQYVSLFPFDEYDDELNMETWEKESVIFDKTDSSRMDGKFNLTNYKPEAGTYEIEVVAFDPTGKEIHDKSFITVLDQKQPGTRPRNYLLFEAANDIEPGENASAKITSSADNLFVIQQIDKIVNGVDTSFFSFSGINNETKNYSFTATEQDRGGFEVNWIFVKHNRVHTATQVINIPWTNKELSIEYATFRDKTLPGSEEKWKLRLTGYKQEKVAGEILASMYDASLDQFYRHNWNKPSIYPYYRSYNTWTEGKNFSTEQARIKPAENSSWRELVKEYDQLNTSDEILVLRSGGWKSTGYYLKGEEKSKRHIILPQASMEAVGNDDRLVANFISVSDSTQFSFSTETEKKEVIAQIRKNFNETAFFFPNLYTDSTGAIEFAFTLPDALTKWKFQALAHTKDLSFGYSSKEIVTQKDLMVQPNSPRFLREGDKMEFSAKIVNLSDKELTGSAEFQLFDAETNQPVDGRFQNMVPNQYFTIAAGQSEAVKFPIEVPFQFNKALVWRIVAKAGNFSDGEEQTLPVLTNRMLVTESITLPVKGAGTKQFSFDKLLASANSESLQHHALTVEYTSNPAWYAVQSLPYLMEYPYDCAEQTWNRYYANSLASMIANSSPKMKQVFEQWKNADTSALLSNLQKNQELKSVLLEETPWVLAAKTEAQQKKNLALLFDMYRMSAELSNNYEKLKQLQSSNGGFVWFNGGPDDRYMTQYILTGIGHLKKLNAIPASQAQKLKAIMDLAIPYLDNKLKQDYEQLIKDKTDLKKYIPYNSIIQYFYMRSFFPEYKIAAGAQTAYNYFMSRLPLSWTQQSIYMKGMTALVLKRKGDAKNTAAILKSLKETSIVHEELGRYWKNAPRSWWWYEAPIERQALLIEAFQEAGEDLNTVDELRTWLLKNKQTNSWESTKATAEACYALLLQGNNWLNAEPTVNIKLGNYSLNSTSQQQEAGTGYFKKTIEGSRILSNMGNISVSVLPPMNQAPVQTTTWGAVYWQYFEDLDKITSAATPLSLNKKLFVETNTDRGPVLTPLADGSSFKVGDKIKVRIELRVDRDMEYMHMKDMRASGLEPVDVLSGYNWQGGLGYYQTTKDASTNFFFSSLRKGTYVFEYTLFAAQAGNFSNGITTIQSMYAPEFAAHSEGIRLTIE